MFCETQTQGYGNSKGVHTDDRVSLEKKPLERGFEVSNFFWGAFPDVALHIYEIVQING